MPKYTFQVAFHAVTVTIDTDNYKTDFAQSKDDLADGLPNPAEQQDVANWVEENWSEYELVDLYSDLDVAAVVYKTE